MTETILAWNSLWAVLGYRFFGFLKARAISTPFWEARAMWALKLSFWLKITLRILTCKNDTIDASSIDRDLVAFKVLAFEVVCVKWVKTVFWLLKIAILDCAHFFKWEIIDSLIFLRFLTTVRLTTHAV